MGRWWSNINHGILATPKKIWSSLVKFSPTPGVFQGQQVVSSLWITPSSRSSIPTLDTPLKMGHSILKTTGAMITTHVQKKVIFYNPDIEIEKSFQNASSVIFPIFPHIFQVSSSFPWAQTAAPKLTIAGACCAAGITFATWEATDHHNSLSMDWFPGTRRFFYEIWVLQCSFQPILGFLWKKGRILIVWLEYRNTPDWNQVIV